MKLYKIAAISLCFLGTILSIGKISDMEAERVINQLYVHGDDNIIEGLTGGGATPS